MHFACHAVEAPMFFKKKKAPETESTTNPAETPSVPVQEAPPAKTEVTKSGSVPSLRQEPRIETATRRHRQMLRKEES